jgi:hypothetical protein
MSWTRWFASSYLTNTGPSTANCTALTAVPNQMTKLDMENGKRAFLRPLRKGSALRLSRFHLHMRLQSPRGHLLLPVALPMGTRI